MTVRLTIVYPGDKSARFDLDYYLDTHLPLSAELLAAYGFRRYTVQRCTATVAGEAPAYRCITHLDFESLAGLRAGLAEQGPALREDFARYTDITPVATVCEVVVSKAVD